MQPTQSSTSSLQEFLQSRRTLNRSTAVARSSISRWAFFAVMTGTLTFLNSDANAGGCNVPTDSPSSPLWIDGKMASPFTQPMLRFEEFGLRSMPEPSTPEQPWSHGPSSLPMPSDEYTIPASQALDAHLLSPLFPEPTRKANTDLENPWKDVIEEYLGRDLDTPPTEGRPEGEWWAHQRWEEFYPREYFQTAQTGARENSGFRNGYQRHGYEQGEFGPDGLYHLPGGTSGIEVRFHPNLPIQHPQALWTFDGTFPPKLLSARYGTPILFRHYNALPIDESANYGFGVHTITTHEHNGHNPSESDGYAGAFFYPGQFYDYHWPMILAGHDTINIHAADDRAAVPDEAVPGGTRRVRGDYRETMSTHWFHDHMLDFTAQNVYKGNSAMMNYYSALDRGNECWNDGVNLRFPSGCGQKYSLPKGDIGAPQQSKRTWGVRDYDIQLALASKAWGQDTSTYPGTSMVTGKNALGEDIVEDQLWFAPFNAKGFVGDRMTVNWLYHPYLDVRARRYRFRVLNADVSRFMRLALVVARDGNQGEFTGEHSGVSYDRVPFHMIANDGNVMEHAVPHDGSMDLDYDGDLSDHHGVLPTLSIAERYDIVVDFGAYKPGSKIYLVNLLEHTDGRGPNREIPLAQVLEGTHDSCDSAVGKFMEIRVHPFSGKDLSMNPVDYIPGRKTMIPLPALSEEEIRDAVHHTFLFGSGGLTDSRPRNLATDFYPSPSGKIWVQGENGKDEGGQFPFISVEQPTSDNPLRDMVEECIAYDLEETDEHLLDLGLTFNDYMKGVPRFSIGDKESSILPFHPDKAWGISTDGGVSLTTDMHRVSAAPILGGLEIWHLENEGAMWSHNVHIHFEEGRILRRDGKAPPEWEKWARKDVYRIGSMDDSGASVDIAIRFREFAGTYMSHCHNTTHEDHAMLQRFDVENPGQLQAFLTPEPQWNGTSYSQSHEEKKASQRSDSHGDVLGKRAFNQDDIAAMLCPPGATGGCPGAISASSVAHQSQALCDADGNGQVDALDLLQIIREPGTKEDGSPLIDWGTCASKCTHRGCSPVARGDGRCGLLGIEGLLVLLPLAMRRRRRESR